MLPTVFFLPQNFTKLSPGQLGHVTDHICIPTKIEFFSLTKYIKQVTCGQRHTLILTGDNVLFGFGGIT